MARKHAASRLKWQASRKAESRYGVMLRKLASTIATMVDGHPKDTPSDLVALEQLLVRYAASLDKWAEAVAARMLAEVDLKDSRTWEQHARQMGYALRRELKNAPTGQVLQALQQEQVRLIKSLPLEAAQRVHDLSEELLSTGQRWGTIVEKVHELGGITRSRAVLIARTETSRAASNLTQARAQFIGSEGYIWRTSADGDVRPSHRRMNGKFVRWDSPPKTDKGLDPYHAGCGPNCRCYAEPVIPD